MHPVLKSKKRRRRCITPELFREEEVGADRLYYKGQTKAPSITLLNTHVPTVTASGTVHVALRLVLPHPAAPPAHARSSTEELTPREAGCGASTTSHPPVHRPWGKLCITVIFFRGKIPQAAARKCSSLQLSGHFREQPPHNKGNDLETCPSHTG